MRPVEFSLEQILTAGQELVEAGRNVTGFALRQKVGGGNPNRLKQVWDEHLASKNTKEAEPVAELPVEVAEEVSAVTKSLTDRLAAFAVDLNDKAVKSASRRVAEVLRTAGEQREQAERELVDAAQTVDDLESRLEAAQTEIQDLKHRLDESQSLGQSRAVELAQLKERLVAFEQSARAAAEVHTREIEQSHAEAKAARTELESARREAAEKIQSLQRELGEQQAKSLALAESHRDQLARIERDTQGLNDRLTHANTAHDAARREAAEAREAAARVTGQLEAVQAQNALLLAAVKDGVKTSKTKKLPRAPTAKE